MSCLEKKLRVATINLLKNKSELDMPAKSITLLSRFHNDSAVLGDLTKIYRYHLKRYPVEQTIHETLAFGKLISYQYPESESLFIENIASLLSTIDSLPISNATASEQKRVIGEQVDRTERMLKTIERHKGKTHLEASIGDLYFENYLSLNPDHHPELQFARSMTGMSGVLRKYKEHLEDRLTSINERPRVGSINDERTRLNAAFRFITKEVTDLTGAPRPSIMQRLIENLHGLNLGRNYGTRHGYRNKNTPQ